MCANYTPVTRLERLRAHFAAVGLGEPVPDETYPGYPAPFVRRAAASGADADASTPRALDFGLFGLVPSWAQDLAIARRTYNARSETADVKPSFRDAWRKGRRCIVPCESIFEPRWDEGRAVRWRIGRSDGAPLGVAALWSRWHGPDGRTLHSFSMLTVNADAHPLLRQFHKQGEEKRMVAILEPDEYDAWLDAPPERMHSLLRCLPADALVAEPAPRLPTRARRPPGAAPAAAADAAGGGPAVKSAAPARTRRTAPPAAPAGQTLSLFGDDPADT